jgi:hypothetical protein
LIGVAGRARFAPSSTNGDVYMSEDEQRAGRQTRAGLNESKARNENELVDRGSAFGEYACECSQKTCSAPLSLSVEEYEEVRKVPTHFIIARGHGSPDVERVVRETSRYQVVEKIGDAAKMAARLDPRSSEPH